MTDGADSISHILRFLIAGVIIAVGLFLLTLFVSAFGAEKTYGSSASGDVLSAGVSDSPNVVTRGIGMVSSTFAGSFGSVGKTAARGGNSVADVTGSVVQDAAGGVAAVGRGLWDGTMLAGRGLGYGAVFAGHAFGGNAFASRVVGPGVASTFRTPVKIMSLAFVVPKFANIIRPADHTTVPIIDPNSPELLAARTALPAAPAAAAAPAAVPQPDTTPAWPIHGAVTTLFGATGWPYRSAHTGIDISDGKAPGVTPVHPFRPGRVVEVVRSNVSLGNHIVVDHGSGVTSVYGHLASLSVQVGQDVTKDTVLGLEGTTGVSTGTHLHFEIRVNGQAANPRNFITGQP